LSIKKQNIIDRKFVKRDKSNINYLNMHYEKYYPVTKGSHVILESQPFFSVLFNESPDAILILDSKDYSILECNEKSLTLFETKTKSSLINLSAFRLFDNETVEFSKDISSSNSKKQGEFTQELAFRTLKQNIFWGKLSKYSVKVDKQQYLILRISKATDYLNTEETLATLLRGTAKVTGIIFFKELSRLLCNTFHVKYAFVAKLSGGKENLQILESYGPFKNILPENYKLKNSLVENVLGGYTTFYPTDVQKLFPKDELVKQNNINGFMGTPVFGSSGEVVGMIAFLDDSPIEEIPNSRYLLSIFASRTAAEIQRIRSKEILKEQARKLATSDNIKDRLLSIITHDLKNPLHTIMGFSELLKLNLDKYDKKNIGDRVEIIDNSIRDIFFFLENLSDWSHIFNGDIRQSPQTISIQDTIEENLTFFQSMLQSKKLKVQVKLTDCPKVNTDKVMIYSIIRNIISNAIKYNNTNGSIVIGYFLSGNFINLTIQDSGKGISESIIQNIMNADHSILEIKTSRQNSLGLGISLSKNFIRRIGGKINFESSLNKGTKVTIAIPKA